MATVFRVNETLDDLPREPGKAELLGGTIVRLMPVGHRPDRISGRIFRSLAEHAEPIGQGFAYTDSMGLAIPRLSPGRQSFSPDASYHDGHLPANLIRIIEGPPTLAVEVRSEGDYTPSADRDMAAKRIDYF